MSDTPDQIEAVSERGTFRVSKSCETHSGWRLVNVSTAPDGMDSAEVWKCPRCLQEELERRDERIRELEQEQQAHFALEDMVLRAKAEQIAGLEQANKKLFEAAESLPLDAFDKPMEEMDAADFVDNSAAFMRAMDLARAALSKHGGTK